jgi:predicted nucleotidyltransferase
MDREAVERDLAPFLARLQIELQPELVLLFGSRARGDSRPYSDYDLIVVSEKFEGMRWRDRVSHLVRIWDRNDMVDLVPYTRAELQYKREHFVTVRAAVDEAVQIYPPRAS